MDGWVGGFEFARGMSGWVDGWMGGWVVYEAYEAKKKENNYAVFYFAGNRFFFYIYEVFTWENK